MAIRAEQVNVQQISFGVLEDSSYVKSQKQACINHKNQKLLIQTPYFLTETYGVPRAGEYYQTLKSRAFFKMPLCDDRREFPLEVDYDAIMTFHQKLVEIDEMMSSNDTKTKLFGDKADKYEYMPIVRQPQVSDDDDEAQKKYYRPAFCKFKLDLAFDSEVPKFRLFDGSSGKRVEVKMNSFEDALKYFKFLTRHRMIVHVFKIYAGKTAPTGEKRKYGLVLKATAIEAINNVSVEDPMKKLLDIFDDAEENVMEP